VYPTTGDTRVQARVFWFRKQDNRFWPPPWKQVDSKL